MIKTKLKYGNDHKIEPELYELTLDELLDYLIDNVLAADDYKKHDALREQALDNIEILRAEIIDRCNEG